ncbi:hypothetical protein AB0R12_34905, partial [Streptomyces niveus]
LFSAVMPADEPLGRGITQVAVRLLAVAGVLALTALLGLPAVAALPPTALLFLVPPLPRTPAARRCLRTPPGRRAASVRTQVAPALLATLERP